MLLIKRLLNKFWHLNTRQVTLDCKNWIWIICLKNHHKSNCSRLLSSLESMSPPNSILINQYRWLFLLKLTRQRRSSTIGAVTKHFFTSPPSYILELDNHSVKRPDQFAQENKKREKPHHAGIFYLSKCHVLKKPSTAIQVHRFRIGFLYNNNSWHSHATGAQKPTGTLQFLHSH